MVKVDRRNFIQVDEYTWRDPRTGENVFRCSGCEEKISWREFEDNKGYCADCRDGRNEAYYRSLH